MTKRCSIDIHCQGPDMGALAVRIGQRCQSMGILGITELGISHTPGNPFGIYTLSWNAPLLAPDGGMGQVKRALKAEEVMVVEPPAKQARQ